jgi:hypothetical protein
MPIEFPLTLPIYYLTVVCQSNFRLRTQQLVFLHATAQHEKLPHFFASNLRETSFISESETTGDPLGLAASAEEISMAASAAEGAIARRIMVVERGVEQGR